MARQSRRVCMFCRGKQCHPLFVYLASINETGRLLLERPDDSYIGITTNPIKRLAELNRVSPDRCVGGRTTGRAAPYWQMELVAGPFTVVRGCHTTRLFQLQWRQESRTLRNRIAYGILAARRSRVLVFARNPLVAAAILVQRQATIQI